MLELLLALGLIAVTILSVLGLSIGIARSNQEGVDRTVGGVVATNLVKRLLSQVKSDNPSGTTANFWGQDSGSLAYEEGVYSNNNTDYNYKIFVLDVKDTAGDPIGDASTENRLKKVDVRIAWWGSEGQARQGQGKLEVKLSRLISESEI